MCEQIIECSRKVANTKHWDKNLACLLVEVIVTVRYLHFASLSLIIENISKLSK